MKNDEMLDELKTLIERVMKNDAWFDTNELPNVTTNIGMMGRTENLRVSNGFQMTLDAFSDETASKQGFMACDVVINPRMIVEMGKQDALWKASSDAVTKYKQMVKK